MPGGSKGHTMVYSSALLSTANSMIAWRTQLVIADGSLSAKTQVY